MRPSNDRENTGPRPTALEGASGVRVRLRRAVALALLGVAYWTLVRPRMLNWGATAAELERELPGDERLPDAGAESTMAVSIDAPPEEVWPWLRQLGQARGGFYSYEWAENLVGLGIHNADEVVPEYQDLSVGDTVRLAREDRFPDAELEVVALAPERALVLQSPDEPSWWVWSFVLDPVGESQTRLIVRSSIREPQNPVVRAAVHAVLDPVTFLMTRGMLRGIKSRAEATRRETTVAVATDHEGTAS